MFRRSRFAWIFLGLALFAGLVAFACSDDEGDTPSDGTPSDTTAEATIDDATPTPYTGVIINPEDVLEKDGNASKTAELKIGWMFEASGPPEVTGFGVPTGDGVKLAVEEINEAGGFQVGNTVYTIKLIEYDTKSTEQDTIANTQALVSDDGVKVIFGPATLGETSATTITQEAEVIHLCPCQEREKHALSSVEKAHGESQWAFQTLLPFSLLVEQGASTFSTEWPDLHSMAFLCQNSATGKDICERTRDAYEARARRSRGGRRCVGCGPTWVPLASTRRRRAGGRAAP
jgi:ABC-type branched-subunit amino acid transport system substrate-binding protein